MHSLAWVNLTGLMLLPQITANSYVINDKKSWRAFVNATQKTCRISFCKSKYNGIATRLNFYVDHFDPSESTRINRIQQLTFAVHYSLI